jgi:hypothetical protein
VKLDPAFIQQLEQAVRRGGVVVIPAPDEPNAERVLPRFKDEAELAVALSLSLKLGRSEGQILAILLANDCSSEGQLLAAANYGDSPKVSPQSIRVIMSQLRKKLAAFGVEITTLRRLGYGLRSESREEICRRLVRYDALLAITENLNRTSMPPKRRATHTEQHEITK